MKKRRRARTWSENPGRFMNSYPLRQEPLPLSAKKSIFYAALPCLAALPVFSYYCFVNQPFYWPNYIDMHYYSAVADSVFNGQGFFDPTQDPRNLVTSAQNGIVFIHLALMKAGILDQGSRLSAILIFHYLLLLLSSVLIYRLFSFFQIRPAVTFMVIAIFIFSNQLFRTLLVPINEGVFFFLAMLLIYLILLYDRKPDLSKFILIASASLIISHFRNQGALIPLCAAVVSAYRREWTKSSALLMAFCLSYLSIHTFYALFVPDLTGIKQFVVDIVNHSLQNNFTLGGIIKPFTAALPVLFLGFGQDAYSVFISYTFPLFLILFLIVLGIFMKYTREARSDGMFVSLVIFANTLLLYFSPVFSFRYIILTFPLLLLILAERFQNAHLFRSLLIVYCLYAVFLTAYRMISIDSVYKENALTTQKVSSQLPADAVLISDDRMTSYFLFRKSACLDCAALNRAKHILIFGDLPYIEDQTKRLEEKGLVSRIDLFGESWVMNPYREPYRLAIVRTGIPERTGSERL